MATSFIRGLRNIPPHRAGCVATIGNFDGVHKGHQVLLAKLKQTASARKLPSLVMTFEPHPQEYFENTQRVPRLTRCREKFVELARFGVDEVLVVRFNEKLSHLSADDFVKKLLVEKLNVKSLIIGDDFRFGAKRQGDFTFLKNMGVQLGFAVESTPSFIIDRERVSSTLIRKMLVAGDHRAAEKLLGRPYSMMGRVVYGDQRGRLLGFPTANIYLHRKMAPVQGVYAVRMLGFDQRKLVGVANVGIRPTVGGTRALLEVHLFNFNEEIYGRYVQVEFCQKLRDEKRFETFDLLKQQIWLDAKQAKNYFEERGEL